MLKGEKQYLFIYLFILLFIYLFIYLGALICGCIKLLKFFFYFFLFIRSIMNNAIR